MGQLKISSAKLSQIPYFSQFVLKIGIILPDTEQLLIGIKGADVVVAISSLSHFPESL